MAERFFELKYDVFVLDFQLNAQSMTNNAAVVEAAVAFLSDLYDDELVALVGVSMGGIISRLAATRAEDAGTPLPISMLVTMDSPHRGAVVDKAFQDFILDEDPTAAVRAFGNQAALELLVYNTNDQTGNTIYDNFYASLRALNNNYGYPLEVPTIGVAFSPFTTGSNPHFGKIWLDINIFAPGFGL